MKTAAAIAGFAALASAQRPMNTSICDYYTTALLKENTAANQEALLTLVVNTAVIGNYTTPNVGIAVAGILAPGEVNGTAVNLLPYFNGGFASSNRGGDAGVAVNFLDDGGAEPLKMNKPSNGNTNSNQYKLLTHLYQYFGALLGCSAMDYPAYMGQPSMGRVHKFMDISLAENTYFIQQVGMSAASFGVADDDITVVANALTKFFNYRCAPATTIIPTQGAQTQSICQAESCPLAENATCDAYPGSGVMPQVANQSLVPSTSGSGSPSATTSATTSPTYTGAASKIGYGLGAGVLALAAFAL